jgi:hypothetical protein
LLGTKGYVVVVVVVVVVVDGTFNAFVLVITCLLPDLPF